MTNEYSTPKITPVDGNKIPTVSAGDASGYQLNEELRDYMVGGVFGTTEQYSSLETYEYGKKLIHEGTEYRCIVPVESPEVFDPDKWEEVSLATLDDNKLDKANVYNGLDKSVEGFVLDARQGAKIQENAEAISSLTIKRKVIDLVIPLSGHGAISVTTPIKYSQIVGHFFYTGQVSDNAGLQLTIAYIASNAGGELDVWYNRPEAVGTSQTVKLILNYIDGDIPTS